MPSVNVRGYDLEYSESGSGEPVVLVHGSASDQRTWQGQREALAERYRVIAYSRRYHWPNAPIAGGADYSMEEQVEDLRALLLTLHTAPAHLVGHSYGAFLCLLLALRDPLLVRSLVLAEPPAITLFVSSVPKPAELLKLLVTRPRTAAALIRFGATGIEPATKAFRRGDAQAGVRIFGDAVFGKGGYERLPGALKAQVQDNLASVKAELLGSGFLPLDPDALPALRLPTLLVAGERSAPVFHRLLDRLHELLPVARRVQIPGASHAMHVDNAPAFNAALQSFYDAQGG
jgi:pimeloyl-ACP methyl ester carboxylesterase